MLEINLKTDIKRKIHETGVDAELVWDTTSHQSVTPKVHSKGLSALTPLPPNHASAQTQRQPGAQGLQTKDGQVWREITGGGVH